MGLSKDQIVRLNGLLDEALTLDEDQRRAWLEHLPPEHADLAEVLRESFLRLESKATLGPGALPEVRFPGGTPTGGIDLLAGARVGPYELIRLLGAGGMAEVWLARRADGAFKRDVALKVPVRMGFRKDLEPRFARERDILAGLEHPHIARLYDAGVSGEGLPYLAMEYVAGEPFTSWCDGHRVGMRERLRLFLQVLDAVQYAHARKVLHRDLKPSNILVTESGQVRLLDFGVGKLLAEETPRTELTQQFGRALTPEYASPELLRGDEVRAASDIYALGVVLYELLSGSRPYRIKVGASLSALEQAVLEARVARPSTQVQPNAAAARATTPARLARDLRGDLDAIVVKTLEREPADRYVDAEALADDLRRFLRGEPVEARPAHATYIARKFMLRHRTGVVMSVSAALMVAAGTTYELTRPRVAVPPSGALGSSSVLLATSAVNDKSVAVLPFVDMSEKKDQEYFSDGLSGKLIDLLAQIQDLHVIARTSSFSFKGRQATVAEIARTLRVAHILEGSVRRAGNTVRVTAQLIRADSGYDIWSRTFERDVSDIFKVQDEIADAVGVALEVKLLDSQHVINAHRTANSEAYNQYLLGRKFFEQLTLDGYQGAVEAFEKAIALDPDYAAAYAGAGPGPSSAGRQGRRSGCRTPMMVAAERAIALAPGAADGYATRGFLRSAFLWDWDCGGPLPT